MPEARFSYGIDLVAQCALAYHLHGVLPEAGGVLDQDATLWDEMHIWLAYFHEGVEISGRQRTNNL